ncbi:condensation domain-containing protein [Micromonospora endophytica]|uniref:Uncharacterized protein n=1 Tax=Micromonospora endophytica TaxID=515350 RepID=A0A2W2CPS6_9ACTN|nr:condensation domain-containing protein [Micromonospora endophytica]PZG00563.1 hypothetical protein C1I93_02275 [Micromonospora endophytica]RIW45829.1 hypothetical protein D3H59_14050 [Micromonospora endophytica]BCJ61915.1 hypothetical protein Jiend_53370 [Micromonospora endophytica]
MSSPTLADRMEIAFVGHRAGEGPLTCGQRNTWQWMRTDVSNPMATLQWRLPLPPGTPVADVVAALATLLARHESLRTTFQEHDGQLRQRILGSGVLAAEIHHVNTSADLNLTAQRMIDQLREKPFALADELPVRLAIAVAGDSALAVVAVYSHMAVDYGSMAILGREFGELVGTAGDRPVEAAGDRLVGVARHQPLDQAAEEASPRGQRRAAAALRYWTDQLRRTPQCLMALPPADDGDTGPASAALRSPAATAALGRIAARTQASPAAAVLAAFSAVVSVRVDQSRCVFASLSSNRFTSRLRDYVGTLAQDGLVVVDVAGPDFDDLVRQTGAAMLRANRNSIFDVADLVTQAVRINHEQGLDFSRDCVFNNISAHLPAGAGEAANVQLPALDPADLSWSPGPGDAESSLTWTPAPPFPNRLVLQLIAVAPAVVLGLSTGDTRHVPRTEITGLLRGVERVLVAAGAGPVRLAEVPDLSGVTPVARDSDWVRVGVSWVQLSGVQELLREALDTPALATAEPDGAGHRLTAHLVAADGIRTPHQAHAACMAHLGGRYAVAAPHRYVLHDSAPADLTDLAAWRTRPVLACGDGRATTEDDR